MIQNNRFKLNHKRVFIFDAIGALLSALLLGVVLPYFQSLIGMPVDILYGLALCALSYCIYDCICFYCCNTKNSRWLYGIMITNLLHCFVTLFLLWKYWAQIKTLCIIYFGSEICVVLLVVYCEYLVLQIS